jgi:phosphate transport system substrate-binding protein
MKPLMAACAAVALVAFAGEALARDQIRIVGSSTVFPFTTAVAEQFGAKTGMKTPVVESTGTGGGMKLFCAGIGENHPDFTNASRRIKESEVADCAKNGVNGIVEIKIGYDGIAVAHSKAGPDFDLTLGQLWLALAKEVPVNGALVPNPYKSWNEIDPALPATKIEVLGPPPTSGTRDSFVELGLDAGCHEAYPAAKELKGDALKATCQTIREDGAFIEAGENDNLIVQKLIANPNAIGVFGFSFLDQNTDTLKSVKLDGVPADFETIRAGQYPMARSMYVYGKIAHVGVVPGMREFIDEYTSDAATGEDGYLADKGLVPLPADEHKAVRAQALGLQPLSM